MTQLIVSIEDNSMISDIEKAIGMLKGVVSVTSSSTLTATDETLSAMKDAKEGNTIKCMSFEDYLEKVK